MFNRYKVSKNKVLIWKRINYLKKNVDPQFQSAHKLIDKLEQSFEVLSNTDPKIEFHTKDNIAFYKLSAKLLDYIADNCTKDENFDCLRIIINLLITDLWKRAYRPTTKTVDISILGDVARFFKEEKKTFDECIDQISIFNDCRKQINSSDSLLSSPTVDSLKYQCDVTLCVVKGYLAEINARKEAILANRQKKAVNSEKVISDYKYSEEINQENESEFSKIKEAGDEYYKKVRSQEIDEVIKLEEEKVVNDKEIVDLEADESITKSNIGLEERVRELLDSDKPDIVSAYACLRHALDMYLKYVKGIDLNLSYFYDFKEDNRKISSPKLFSSQVFKEVFGEGNFKYVDSLWSASSNFIHGGDAVLDYELYPEQLSSIRAKIIGYASFMDPLIDLENVDFVEGVKKLYIIRKKTYDEFNNLCLETVGKKYPNRDYTLENYKKFLLKKGVEQSFFEELDKPKDIEPKEELVDEAK